jgi:hypothetical protein
VSIGITGRDTVAEHASGVEAERRERAESGNSTPTEDLDNIGSEEIMDLSFGACKLQVQVPEKGKYVEPRDLIGKNIGTSFVHLAEDYFAALEAEKDGGNGVKGGKRKLKTKIIELSGSVEAACALGVADGIVDLVGMHVVAVGKPPLTIGRIRRDHEGRGIKGNRHRSVKYSSSHQVKEPHKPSIGRSYRVKNIRSHQYVPTSRSPFPS